MLDPMEMNPVDQQKNKNAQRQQKKTDMNHRILIGSGSGILKFMASEIVRDYKWVVAQQISRILVIAIWEVDTPNR